jgi:PRTRC genetic system protein C
MSIEVKPIARRFLYNGITLPDVPGLEPRAVRDLYAAQYPELLSAEIEAGPIQEQEGLQEFTFRKAVGTKGTGRRNGRLARFVADVQAQADGHLPPSDVRLAEALRRPGTERASRAWDAFATQSLVRTANAAASHRIVLPSESLAPLP